MTLLVCPVESVLSYENLCSVGALKPGGTLRLAELKRSLFDS